jgi:monoterpene epsilon-lactone hydrolase
VKGAAPSLQARLVSLALRVAVRPMLARQSDPKAARRDFLRSARLFLADPPGMRFRDDHVGVPGLWAEPDGPAAGVLLYVHGGAFVMGAPRTHRALAGRLAAEAGLRALLPDYRLAPEHPFPAALEDLVAAYRALTDRGEAIALAGDSAGGGLALSLLAEVQARGLPQPAGLVAFSPVVDLTFSGPSFRENAARDAMLPADRAGFVRGLWLQGADPTDPRASPLFADWPAPPPPALLFASDSELLRDDALRMAARLRDAGGQAEARIAADLPHAWPELQGWLPEAGATITEAAAFLRTCVEARRDGDARKGR